MLGRETRSLILWEESRLSVFENEMLNWEEYLNPNVTEVTVSWTKLHNEEFHIFCAPFTNIIKTIV
jgi:hypothetical protein